jgi:hypothetical protein
VEQVLRASIDRFVQLELRQLRQRKRQPVDHRESCWSIASRELAPKDPLRPRAGGMVILPNLVKPQTQRSARF